jgi:hypothetical protein
VDVDAVERRLRRVLVDDGHEMHDRIAAVGGAADRVGVSDVAGPALDALRPSAHVALGVARHESHIVAPADESRHRSDTHHARPARD